MLTKNQKIGIGLGVVVAVTTAVILATREAEAGFDPWVYDKNGNGYIDTDEALEATNDWTYDKTITKEQLDQVVALWKNHTPKPK